MDKRKNEYVEMARLIEAEFHARQDAGILANLNKKNVEGLHVTRDKILKDMREQLKDYQDETGKELTEEEKDFVVDLIKKELWGYGIIDDLIHEETISDIKLYGPEGIRIKKTGKRSGSDISFSDEVAYKVFVTKLLERNELNLGTANAIQTFTDESQDDFIFRITVIYGLLGDGE